MMKRIIFALVGSALAVSVASANDDIAIGSRLKRAKQPITNGQKGEAEQRSDTYRFLECGVNRQEGPMHRILDISDDKGYRRAMESMSGLRGCKDEGRFSENAVEISFRFDTATARGMIAEALLKKNQRLNGHPVMALQRTYPRGWYVRTTRPQAIDEMAACVAETNPDGIAALLLTNHGSPEEIAATRALSPSLGACLVAGAKLSANRLALRSAFAEALYHRAFDAAEEPNGAAKAEVKP
jgi:hypothetical protein